MTLNEPSEPRLEAEDKHLVDLVTAVLVDPNLHTDTRMRLDWEITEILRSADAELYRRSSREHHARPRDAHEPVKAPVDSAPEMLSSVLVDPNLHTDVRMRIHREISEILRGASTNDSGRPSGAPRR